jgi:hypothetical protein
MYIYVYVCVYIYVFIHICIYVCVVCLLCLLCKCVLSVCVFIYIYNVVFGIRTSPGVEWWEMVETRGGRGKKEIVETCIRFI